MEKCIKQSKNRIVLSTVMTLIMILGCLALPPSGSVSQAASKLKVTAPKTVAVNQTVTIKTNVTAKFTSSNKKIATVSSKGVVKGKKAGTVKITVTSKKNKNQKKTVKIKVQNKLVITAPAKSKAILYVGENVKIKTNLTSTYKSSNTQVAEVNSSGKVTAISAGTAKITVTSKKYKKLKKTVTITVQSDSKTTPTEPSTELPTETPTEDPITEEPSTETPIEDPTTEESSTETPIEDPTTEEPSTETPTEDPTTEEPIEEKTIVGLEVKYPGERVPKSLAEFLIKNKYNFNYNLVYNDGTKEKFYLTYDNEEDMVCKYKGIVEKDGLEYAQATLTYKGSISSEVSVQVVDTGDYLCPLMLPLRYNGERLSVDEVPKFEDITFSICYTDYTEDENVQLNRTNFSSYLYEVCESKRLRFVIYYNYVFKDDNGDDVTIVLYNDVYIDPK